MNHASENKKTQYQVSKPVELLLWLIIPFILSLRFTLLIVADPDEIRYLFRDYYWDLIIATLMIAFPIFFNQIFGSFPLQLLLKNKNPEHQSIVNIGGDYIVSSDISNDSSNPEKVNSSDASGTALLFTNAVNSRSLAKGIYGRSGVYLLLGVLVAFSGLVFFYTQTATLNIPTQAGNFLLLLAPKFGILFFIEFVAFFFLRQYRSAMDEFRYYESIARKREEVNALLRLSADSDANIKLMELIKNDSYFSKSSVLEKNQTTEIIEARKLEKGEIDLLEKVVETLAKAKR
ncbi:hypothetical protein [Pseudomonas pergaminensis]